jgi:hypothetical protein
MRKGLISALIILSLATLDAYGKTNWNNWPDYRELKGALPATGGFAAVHLDDGIWPLDQGGLESLRLADGAMGEVPYFIRVDRQEESTREFPTTLLENKVLIGEKTQVLVDLGQARNSNRVTLETPNEGFTRKAVVEGSLDKMHWKVLLADGFLFDVTNTNHQARKAYLSYPDSKARYLRVTVPLSGQKDAFIVEKVSVRAYFPATGRLDEKTYPGDGAKSEKGETVWVIDRGRAGLPLGEVAFDFESRDFYRAVQVEVSDDQKDWQSLSTCGFLYDAQKGGIDNQWKVSGPEVQGRYARITITDRDDHPLKVKKIILRHWQRTLLFRDARHGPYKLYYGNGKAEARKYDLASWAARYKSFETKYDSMEVAWDLGGEKTNPTYEPPVTPVTERPYFVWGLLAGLMGLLGWILWGSFKKLLNEKRR